MRPGLSDKSDQIKIIYFTFLTNLHELRLQFTGLS